MTFPSSGRRFEPGPPLSEKGLVPGRCRDEALRALVHQHGLMQWVMHFAIECEHAEITEPWLNSTIGIRAGGT
jgi:hypothetical protein